jgi:AcrR family transcriptional regulator
MRTRLDPSERRRQIVEAAMPLFARQGFSGTTTKQVAEAAKVSEGLLFKYFASKTALYAAIVEQCSNEDPGRFRALEQLPPSTATLAVIVHDVVAYFAMLKLRSDAEQSRHRLFLHSLTDDGEFARVGMAAFREAMIPLLERSLAVAEKTGDLAEVIPAARSFHFAALLQITLGSVALHGGLNTADAAPNDESVRNATAFILRGMGVKPEAVRRVCANLDWRALPGHQSEEMPRTARVA